MPPERRGAVRDVSSPWLSVADAAAYAGIGVRRIYAAAKSGALAATRVDDRGTLRLHRDDIDRWLRALRTAVIPVVDVADRKVS